MVMMIMKAKKEHIEWIFAN